MDDLFGYVVSRLPYSYKTEWEAWIDHTSFERRMCHRNKREESAFTDWHNKEIFAVHIARRPDLYQLAQEWLYVLVQMPPLYRTVNPMLYMYLASSTLKAKGVHSRTFDAIWVAEYARYALPKVLCVTQWVTSHRDYSDNRIGRPESEMNKFTRPCIWALSKRVNDFWCHWQMVQLVANEPQGPIVSSILVVLRRCTGMQLSVVFKCRVLVGGSCMISRRVL